MTVSGRRYRRQIAALTAAALVAGVAVMGDAPAVENTHNATKQTGPGMRAPGTSARGNATSAPPLRSKAPRAMAPERVADSPTLKALAARSRFTGKASRPELMPPRPGAPEAARRAEAPHPRYVQPVQRAPMPGPVVDANGQGATGYLPPDTTGDVGPNDYVQAVNIALAVFDKQGNLRPGSRIALSSLWQPIGGVCSDAGAGDPIVLYDELADRWLISQFAFYPLGSTGYHQCIAISKTGDPLGTYTLYDYLVSETLLNDYPKFGVWPDGYYASINQFDGQTLAFVSSAVLAFDRQAMVAGDHNARAFIFDLRAEENTQWAYGLLPSDLDGSIPPPAGTPNFLVALDDFNDRLRVFHMRMDWATPSASDLVEAPSIPVAPFSGTFSCTSGLCIGQPGTPQGLDQLSDRLMYRLAYRNFGDHESLVLNHTINVGIGTDQAGIRWYEIRDPSAEPVTTHQFGTYFPDATHRFMGAIAMDAEGNIALGYTASSTSIYPSIRYAGRLASDPLGQLPRDEVTLVEGAGSQTHPQGRWGDYSAMSVDPSDGCTFWYSNEYYESTSTSAWTTRIGSFKFDECEAPLAGQLSGVVKDAITGLPVRDARVRAGSYETVTGADGTYTFTALPPATYSVTASRAPTHGTSSAVLETVEDGTVSTADLVVRSITSSDFDGDGREDAAFGVPNEYIGRGRPGAVSVVYGSSTGLAASGDEMIHQGAAGVPDSNEDGDAFGAALAHGDFDGDGFDDLAIGAPNENSGAGAVHVLYGGPEGLLPAQRAAVWRQGVNGIGDISERGDRFGSSLAAGDLTGDGYADLAIGVPFEDVGSRRDVGVVVVLKGGPTGLTAAGNRLWTQNSYSGGHIEDSIEPGDRFGHSVAIGDLDGSGIADLIVGVPYETINGDTAAGVVHVLFGTKSGPTGAGDQLWHQDRALGGYAVAGATTAGDTFGYAVATTDTNNDGYDELIVGIPGEDIGRDRDAGAISVLFGSATGPTARRNQIWHQDSRTGGYVNDAAEPLDRFGDSIAGGDINGDRLGDIVIGVPGEDTSGRRNTGAVAVLYGASAGVTGAADTFLTQSTMLGGARIGGSPEAYDTLGKSVGVIHAKGGAKGAILAGVPGEDLGRATDAGAALVVYVSGTRLTGVGDHLWTQDSAGPSGIEDNAQSGDRYGAAVA